MFGGGRCCCEDDILVETSDRVATAAAQYACCFLSTPDRPPPRLKFRENWGEKISGCYGGVPTDIFSWFLSSSYVVYQIVTFPLQLQINSQEFFILNDLLLGNAWARVSALLPLGICLRAHTVCVVFTLNRYFCATTRYCTTVHPVPILIPYPRDILILLVWSQIVRYRR